MPLSPLRLILIVKMAQGREATGKRMIQHFFSQHPLLPFKTDVVHRMRNHIPGMAAPKPLLSVAIVLCQKLPD